MLLHVASVSEMDDTNEEETTEAKLLEGIHYMYKFTLCLLFIVNLSY